MRLQTLEGNKNSVIYLGIERVKKLTLEINAKLHYQVSRVCDPGRVTENNRDAVQKIY